ncbi:MAG: molybdopterin-dependent oxidoreductase [Nitrospirae bacterium]|nr:molybdopterin-dependent oxidoreductase [Nitrospirota bacterium]
MANTIKLTIDGKEIHAPEGMNLIDAAELGGIHIPNLCYLKGLKGIGACRLCMVEVEGLKAPMIACTTKVKEGMAVRTKTEKVLETRKFVIDLILSMHPLDCMTCTKAGVCNLQNYAYDFEIKESNFTRKKFGFSIDEANPFIKRDPDYCVLCGRCVRVCKNQGTNVLEFMGRGVGSKVTTANDKPLHESGCTFCGSCVDVCPVNALLEADRWRRGREWDYDKVKSVCLLCGNACDISVSTKDSRLVKVNAGAADGSPEKYICAYGRFGFDCIEADTRVRVPMKRVNGQLQETTWEDALGIVAKEMKKAGENAGFITPAGILNEDALTLKRLASDAVKTKNVDSTASLYGDESTLLSGGADLESADLFVLVGLNPNQWKRALPALDATIRRRVNAGAKLITINSAEPNISSVAAVNLVGDEPETLRALVKAIMDKGIKADGELASAVSDAPVTEMVEAAAGLFVGAKNPVILSSPALYPAAANVTLLKGAAVSMPVESNAKGIILMGIKKEGKTYGEMTTEGMKLLYAVGEVPLSRRPSTDFLIVQTSHLTEIAKQADVVLPAAAYLEADGTIVDYLGRLKQLAKAVEPAGEARSHREIFVALSEAMGTPLKEAKESETKKLAKMKPVVAFNPFTRREELEGATNEIMQSMNMHVIDGSRLLWLTESEKALA